MAKVQHISGITKRLPFEDLDFYDLFRITFENITKKFPYIKWFTGLIINFLTAAVQLVPIGTSFGQNELRIKEVLEPLDYQVSSNDDLEFSIRSANNCIYKALLD